MLHRNITAAIASLLLAGCGATTGVDVEAIGAEVLGGDQLRVEGSAAGKAIHTSTVPASPRALGHIEDVRVIVDESLAGQELQILGTVLKAGQPVGTPAAMEGRAILVAGKTKRIVLCFDPAGCP